MATRKKAKAKTKPQAKTKAKAKTEAQAKSKAAAKKVVKKPTARKRRPKAGGKKGRREAR